MLSVQPQPTPYDVHFSLFGIPVRIHPFFWIAGVLLGAGSNDPIAILIWVVVLFVSILIHELGHAAAIICYGWRPEIVLYAFGGLTSHNPGFTPSFASYSRQGNRPMGRIIISLAGPFAGFLFAGVIIALLFAANRSFLSVLYGLFGIGPIWIGTGPPILPDENPELFFLIWDLLVFNILWGAINLLPVYPLDGGHISRELFLVANPYDGVRQSLILSIAVGAGMALVGLLHFHDMFIGILFGLLAFNSYQMLQFYSRGGGGPGGSPW